MSLQVPVPITTMKNINKQHHIYPMSTTSNYHPYPQTQIDYSKYMIDVICKFLESFRHLCHFTEDISQPDLRHFIKSILHQSKISYSTVSTGLLYLLWCKQALRRNHNNSTSKNSNKINFTAISITQLFVASQILSSKYLNDRNASNSAWSKISGICLESLNRMEMLLLSAIEYRLHVEVDLFNRWINFLFQPTKLNNYFSSDEFMEKQMLKTRQRHTNAQNVIKRTRLL